MDLLQHVCVARVDNWHFFDLASPCLTASPYPITSSLSEVSWSIFALDFLCQTAVTGNQCPRLYLAHSWS
jgi:hypothetical protein